MSNLQSHYESLRRELGRHPVLAAHFGSSGPTGTSAGRRGWSFWPPFFRRLEEARRAHLSEQSAPENSRRGDGGECDSPTEDGVGGKQRQRAGGEGHYSQRGPGASGRRNADEHQFESDADSEAELNRRLENAQAGDARTAVSASPFSHHSRRMRCHRQCTKLWFSAPSFVTGWLIIICRPLFATLFVLRCYFSLLSSAPSREDKSPMANPRHPECREFHRHRRAGGAGAPGYSPPPICPAARVRPLRDVQWCSRRGSLPHVRRTGVAPRLIPVRSARAGRPATRGGAVEAGQREADKGPLAMTTCE